MPACSSVATSRSLPGSALEMERSGWIRRGGLYVSLSEHHRLRRRLPAQLGQLVMAGGDRGWHVEGHASASTQWSAPFHDPLRLAEDAAVVDLFERRVELDLTIGGGYVGEEFAMFGVVCRSARRAFVETRSPRCAPRGPGEPLRVQGRTVRVLPAPAQPGGPEITLGGQQRGRGAPAAARIAGRLPPRRDRSGGHTTGNECMRLGKPDPAPVSPSARASWCSPKTPRRPGPFLVPDFSDADECRYGAWQVASGVQTPYKPVADLDELRATGQYRILTPPAYAAELKGSGGFAFAMLHPMAVGCRPSWRWAASPPLRAVPCS